MEGLMSGDTYIIRGRVKDSVSGSPIRNAEVRLLRKYGTGAESREWVEREPPHTLTR